MGFFDKVKAMLGQHGVTVEITRIERQPPDQARFPITDTVCKANLRVKTEKEATILSHTIRLILKFKNSNEEIILDEDSHTEETEIIGGDVTWPYTIKPGQPVDDGMMVGDVDIPVELEQRGFKTDINELNRAGVRLYVQMEAEVQGSLFDAKAETPLIMIQSDSETESEDDSLDNPEMVQVHELAPEQRIRASIDGQSYQEGAVVSVDTGDLVNAPKAFIRFDDGSEHFVKMNRIQRL